MIATLQGKLAQTLPDGAVLEVGGVGYRVLLPVPSIADLPSEGRTVRIHTQLVVREDSMTLYGFSTADQRDLFEILQTVNGIGPKAALSILGVHTPDAFRKAVSQEDLDALTMIPGIGKKTAQRMIIDLKEKLTSIETESVPSGAPSELRQSVEEAKQALAALGYRDSEIKEAMSGIDLTSCDGVEAIIKTALGGLAR